MGNGNAGQVPLRDEPVKGRREWPAVIAGIGIGLLTIWIGSWVLMFAGIGGVDWEPFYWLVLVWMVAPVAAGVAALLSLRVATGIAAIPVALGLTLTGFLLWGGDTDDGSIAFLSMIAAGLPAVLLVACLSRFQWARGEGPVGAGSGK